MKTPVVLSIAGYDPTSGAGVTADIKTAAAHKCYAVSCITALTVQTTERVFCVEPVREEIVRDTLYELVRDLPPAAVRIGMLSNAAIAETVAEFLETVRPPNVVLDPVLRSTSGAALIDDKGEKVLRERLLKLVDVMTPNGEEASILGGDFEAKSTQNRSEIELRAQVLRDLGARAVVITGGNLDEAADFLLSADAKDWFVGPKIRSKSTHGTGCAFAMSIACNLAQGSKLRDAVAAAQKYVRQAIEAATPLGQGFGPMEHLFKSQ